MPKSAKVVEPFLTISFLPPPNASGIPLNNGLELSRVFSRAARVRRQSRLQQAAEHATGDELLEVADQHCNTGGCC